MSTARFDELYNKGLVARTTTQVSKLKAATEQADFLIKLHELKERGLITANEFENAKRQSLGQ